MEENPLDELVRLSEELGLYDLTDNPLRKEPRKKDNYERDTAPNAPNYHE